MCIFVYNANVELNLDEIYAPKKKSVAHLFSMPTKRTKTHFICGITVLNVGTLIDCICGSVCLLFLLWHLNANIKQKIFANKMSRWRVCRFNFECKYFFGVIHNSINRKRLKD